MLADPVRAAVALLKQQGLITGVRGKAPVVRVRARQVLRSSERHQVENDLVLASEDERRVAGASETEIRLTLTNWNSGLTMLLSPLMRTSPNRSTLRPERRSSDKSVSTLTLRTVAVRLGVWLIVSIITPLFAPTALYLRDTIASVSTPP
jgi:hypothetical protein